MISGQQALREIEQATVAVRSQESECAALLQGADQDLARLRAARGALLRQLASARLDAMQSEKISGELASAEAQALALIAKGKASLDALAARLDAAQAARAGAEADRHARAEEVTAILGDLEALQARVEPQVRGSAEWIGQKEIVDRAQRVYEAADAKADRAEADRAAKGKPYEDDPLFKYLWSRGFGTSAYRSGFFVRYIDEKIAWLVGFQGARANYAMLNEIPLRLRAHEERCRAAFEAERQKLEEIEKAGLAAAGAGALEERLRPAEAALTEARRAPQGRGCEAARARPGARRRSEDRERGRLCEGDRDSSRTPIAERASAAFTTRRRRRCRSRTMRSCARSRRTTKISRRSDRKRTDLIAQGQYTRAAPLRDRGAARAILPARL